jgi:chemotaxis protein CheX
MQKVEYINPFIESVGELFTTMLAARASRGKPEVAGDEADPTEVTALIGWSGPARGTVALALPEKTAMSVAERLLSIEMTEMTDDVLDAVSEVVNIIAGGAKAKFSEQQGIGTIDLSLPTVVCGGSYDVQHPSQATRIEVPFESDLGPFCLRVTFEHISKRQTAAQPA